MQLKGVVNCPCCEVVCAYIQRIGLGFHVCMSANLFIHTRVRSYWFVHTSVPANLSWVNVTNSNRFIINRFYLE